MWLGVGTIAGTLLKTAPGNFGSIKCAVKRD